MPRIPKPWFRKDRNAWFVTVRGTRHNLGPDRTAAFERFYELMNQPKSVPSVASTSFAVIADSFLDWVKANRAPDTFEWYRYRLERFCRRYPDLVATEIKPYHVQTWVDSYSGFSQTSKRNYIRSVKRCVAWANIQGYLKENPLVSLEAPSAESRDVCVPPTEFENLCSFIPCQQFLQLCKATYEIGCRPQEILRVEARHLDEVNGRWVLPIREAKGKRKPRIIYLPDMYVALSRELAMTFPQGPIFRNSRGNAWTTDAVCCNFTRLQIRMGKAEIERRGLELDRLVSRELAKEGKPKIDSINSRKRKSYRDRLSATFAPRYSLYGFRHSWATRALQSGLDALTVAVLMGHNDPSTLSRVYQHLSHNPEHLRKQAISINRG